mgnify:CR=1 FL=1
MIHETQSADAQGLQRFEPGAKKLVVKEGKYMGKYVLKFDFHVMGLVEESDIIGAIFGQLEGLFGDELELRELQRTGRIGRIKAIIKHKNGGCRGVITLVSNLNKAETALIAAAFETIDKVGPYRAEVKLRSISDAREEKRKEILKRAVEIVRMLNIQSSTSLREMIETITREGSLAELTTYGPERLPSGPDIDKASEIILVEGRADVLNMLKHGWRNVIAIGGAAEIPETIKKLSKEKEVTALLDGDRGGKLILMKLLNTIDLDYVAFAPKDKEVEELSVKEINRALKNRVPAEEFKSKMGITHREEALPTSFKEYYEMVKDTENALLIDRDMKIVKKVKIDGLHEELEKSENIYCIVYDGFISQRIVDAAGKAGVQFVVGRSRLQEVTRIPAGLKIIEISRE